MTFGRWLRATWLGWILGVPLIALFALLGEAVGIGLLQALVLRGTLGTIAPWTLATVVGTALPFLAYDVARFGDLDLPYSLYAYVPIGGLLVGIGQAYLLRSHAKADAMFQARMIRGWSGLATYLGIIAIGGGILGVVTGIALTRLLRR